MQYYNHLHYNSKLDFANIVPRSPKWLLKLQLRLSKGSMNARTMNKTWPCDTCVGSMSQLWVFVDI